ncbi:hypothetical protein D3C73_525500 [compost metagenome]
MAGIHADEAAADIRVRMRSAFADDIRREQQAAAAGRNGVHTLKQRLKAFIPGKGFLEPGKAVTGSQRNTHNIIGILLPVVEEVHLPFKVQVLIALIRQHHTGGADAAHGPAFAKNAGTKCAAGVVCAAGEHFGGRQQPGGFGNLRQQRAGQIKGFHKLRTECDRQTEGLSDFGAPGFGAYIQQQRACGIRIIHGVITRQTVTHIILRQQEQLSLCQHLRLILLHPENLRQREAFQCTVSGNFDQLGAKYLLDLPALRRSPGIVPENGRTQRFALAVHQHQPVHLSGEADAVYLRRVYA